MARRLLAIVKSQENILSMTQDELAYALLEDMQARLEGPFFDMANRHRVGTDLFTVGAFYSSGGNNAQNVRDLANRIDKLGREALALLERWGLAEPADDTNGRNGFMVLTDKGKTTTERTDFERVRVRRLLREEMLHPRLQGQIYGYFAADDLGTAVFESLQGCRDRITRGRRVRQQTAWKGVDGQSFCGRRAAGETKRRQKRSRSFGWTVCRGAQPVQKSRRAYQTDVSRRPGSNGRADVRQPAATHCGRATTHLEAPTGKPLGGPERITVRSSSAGSTT